MESHQTLFWDSTLPYGTSKKLKVCVHIHKKKTIIHALDSAMPLVFNVNIELAWDDEMSQIIISPYQLSKILRKFVLMDLKRSIVWCQPGQIECQLINPCVFFAMTYNNSSKQGADHSRATYDKWLSRSKARLF